MTHDPYRPAGDGAPDHSTVPYPPPAPYGQQGYGQPGYGQSGWPDQPRPYDQTGYPNAPAYPDSVHPGAGAYPGGGYPPPCSPYPAPRNNGVAVAALLTGLAGFCCVCAPVAIGLGIGGLSVARRTGVGRGMSIAGIVLGTGWLLIFTVLALVVWQSLPSTF